MIFIILVLAGAAAESIYLTFEFINAHKVQHLLLKDWGQFEMQTEKLTEPKQKCCRYLMVTLGLQHLFDLLMY